MESFVGGGGLGREMEKAALAREGIYYWRRLVLSGRSASQIKAGGVPAPTQRGP